MLVGMVARWSSTWITAQYGKECQVTMTTIPFAGTKLTVATGTEPVWEALEDVFSHHKYAIRPAYPAGDTGAYNCRKVTGGTSWSPHAFGVAADVNWNTNPYRKTPDRRAIIWGYDTDMPPAMIDDVRRIVTRTGQRAVEWGGDWKTIKDAMHFQVIATRAEIATGIVSPVTTPSPEPEPASWTQPGDPIRSPADAAAALYYQAGRQYWESTVGQLEDKELIKVGKITDRAMWLDGGLHEIKETTEETLGNPS